ERGHGLASSRINRWLAIRLHSREGGVACAKEFVVADVKGPEQPVEPELLKIVLVYFDELRLDLHLPRSSHRGLLHKSVYQFQVVDRIADNQPAALRQKMRTRTGRKWH